MSFARHSLPHGIQPLGYYEFTGLTPGWEYRVEFTLPLSFDDFTVRQVTGAPTSDGDNDGPVSDIVVLKSGEHNPTIDAGVIVYAALGDLVWNDLNEDGLQDNVNQSGGEPGIAGVTVELLADLDGDGAIDDVVATTTTADGSGVHPLGYYEFTGLMPGVEYQVRFGMASGFRFTGRQVDGDPDGVFNSDGPLSDVIVLMGEEFNRTIDAGMFGDNAYCAIGTPEPGRPLYICVETEYKTLVSFTVSTKVGRTTTHDGQGYVEIENAEFFATGIYCTQGCNCVVYHVPPELAGQTIYIQAYEYFPDFVLRPLLTLQVAPPNPLRVTEIGSDVDPNEITQADMDVLAPVAIQRLEQAGLPAAQAAVLRATPVTVATFSSKFLGRNGGGQVEVDDNAAQHGWYVDPMPFDDAEFQQVAGATELRATAGPAAGEMDLLTVLMHEFGNLVGLSDIAYRTGANPLMADHLTSGTRRLPADLADATYDPVTTQAPLAFSDNVSTTEDSAVVIDVLGNDAAGSSETDPATLVVTEGSGPAHGSVDVGGGVVTYTPSANFAGMDRFQYRFAGTDGRLSNEAIVTVSVAPVADYHNALLPSDVDNSGLGDPRDVILFVN